MLLFPLIAIDTWYSIYIYNVSIFFKKIINKKNSKKTRKLKGTCILKIEYKVKIIILHWVFLIPIGLAIYTLERCQIPDYGWHN